MPPKDSQGEASTGRPVTRRTVIRGVGVCGVVGLAGCSGEDPAGEGTMTEEGTPGEPTAEVTDLAGRTVEVPDDISDVIAVGPGALRVVAQAGGADTVVGVEEAETQWLTEVPYSMANPGLRDRTVIGGRGGDAEQIVAQEPDVLFSTGGTEELNTLQERTNVPTLGIGTGELIDIGAPTLEEVWDFLGDVLGTEDVTDPMVSSLSEIKADYLDRTDGLGDDAMPGVYVTAVSFRGGQGIDATRPLFASFELLGRVNNVAGDIEYEGIPHVTVSREQLLEWDPEVIFVDQGNSDLVREDVRNNPEYEELRAIQEGNVYGILPHAQYALNHANILANTYYMGQVMYPDRFGDVEAEARADEIFEMVYGEALYDDLSEMYGGLEPIDLT